MCVTVQNSTASTQDSNEAVSQVNTKLLIESSEITPEVLLLHQPSGCSALLLLPLLLLLLLLP